MTGDQREAVLNSVELYFKGERRFTDTEWLEPGRVLAGGTGHNFSTGGEGVKVEVNAGDGITTTLVEVTSISVPIYDWGKNQRNVDSLVNHLRKAGFVFEVTSSEGKRKVGGPT
jgi:hypothetical protein